MSSKKAASEHLKNGGIVTLNEMINRFGFSRTGTFNFFRRENCYSSINFKGQYHIKNSCLKFNRYGLAKKDEKIFSKHGNLLQTIVGLIENSDSGLTIAELNSLVATTVHMQCRRLYAKGVIFRKKFNGVYYYFSADQDKRTIQLQEKTSLSKPVKLNSILETETTENMQDIVKVLVTCVKQPELSAKGIALSLCRRGNNIRTKQVAEIFNRYGIAKKNS